MMAGPSRIAEASQVQPLHLAVERLVPTRQGNLGGNRTGIGT